MRILFGYLKQYRLLILLALLLAAINQVFSLLDPLIFRHIIDRYATRYDQYSTGQFIRGVLLLLGAAVGVAFVSRVAKNFQDYFVNVITQRLGAQLYSDGIRHSLALPYQVFEDQRSGETLGKLQKARSDSERFITSFVNVMFTTLVGVVFVVIYAAKVHWAIAPAFLLTIPLLGGLSSVLSREISWFSRPRDFTSSTLRRVSVVEPASSAVWVTITRCWVLMRRLRKNISVPSDGASSA
jgi:ATP-binding cassette subfamily B protein